MESETETQTGEEKSMIIKEIISNENDSDKSDSDSLGNIEFIHSPSKNTDSDESRLNETKINKKSKKSIKIIYGVIFIVYFIIQIMGAVSFAKNNEMYRKYSNGINDCDKLNEICMDKICEHGFIRENTSKTDKITYHDPGYDFKYCQILIIIYLSCIIGTAFCWWICNNNTKYCHNNIMINYIQILGYILPSLWFIGLFVSLYCFGVSLFKWIPNIGIYCNNTSDLYQNIIIIWLPWVCLVTGINYLIFFVIIMYFICINTCFSQTPRHHLNTGSHI